VCLAGLPVFSGTRRARRDVRGRDLRADVRLGRRSPCFSVPDGVDIGKAGRGDCQALRYRTKTPDLPYERPFFVRRCGSGKGPVSCVRAVAERCPDGRRRGYQTAHFRAQSWFLSAGYRNETLQHSTGLCWCNSHIAVTQGSGAPTPPRLLAVLRGRLGICGRSALRAASIGRRITRYLNHPNSPNSTKTAGALRQRNRNVFQTGMPTLGTPGADTTGLLGRRTARTTIHGKSQALA
jgi:hypothetical protein